MDAKEFVEIAKEVQEVQELCVGWAIVQSMKEMGMFGAVFDEFMKNKAFVKWMDQSCDTHADMRHFIKSYERQKTA